MTCRRTTHWSLACLPTSSPVAVHWLVLSRKRAATVSLSVCGPIAACLRFLSLPPRSLPCLLRPPPPSSSRHRTKQRLDLIGLLYRISRQKMLFTPTAIRLSDSRGRNGSGTWKTVQRYIEAKLRIQTQFSSLVSAIARKQRIRNKDLCSHATLILSSTSSRFYWGQARHVTLANAAVYFPLVLLCAAVDVEDRQVLACMHTQQCQSHCIRAQFNQVKDYVIHHCLLFDVSHRAVVAMLPRLGRCCRYTP